MHVPRSMMSLLLVSALAACGGGDSPTGPGNGGDGGNGGNGSARVIKDNPSYSQDIFEIFTRRGCTAGGCHGSGEGGLTMTSAGGAYGNLVNVAAVGRGGEVRVIPGNAAGSYLVKKLEGASGIAGAQMPLGSGPLDNIDLTNIKNWINQGANNN